MTLEMAWATDRVVCAELILSYESCSGGQVQRAYTNGLGALLRRYTFDYVCPTDQFTRSICKEGNVSAQIIQALNPYPNTRGSHGYISLS